MKKDEKDDNRDLHTFASFVHGSLFSLHALGFVYNLKRGNYKTAIFHGGAAMFDLICTKEHLDVTRNKKDKVEKK
jgi:hypothetical protein